jgi:plasmid segregation protein ParM
MHCLTVGIDSGKSALKCASANGLYSHPSRLFNYRDFKVENSQLGSKDYIVSFKGKKYFAGTLGVKEGEFGVFHSGLTKINEATLINILVTLSRYNEKNFKLVVGCPISIRTAEEKESLSNMIRGIHQIEVNGKLHTINILECKVAPEGAGAFWSQPRDGIVNGLDFGSTTVNYFTVDNKEYRDRKSGTFNWGFENVANMDYEAMAASISSNLENKWNKREPVMLCGGGAKIMEPFIKKHFSNCYLAENPVHANSIGFHRIGVAAYE